MNIRPIVIGIVSMGALALQAHADTATFCVQKQAPSNYEKYNGATAIVVKSDNVSITMTVNYANGGEKTYKLPFLVNGMYSNEDTFVSVSFRSNDNEIYFSDPNRNDWFSATKCG
tara:strand:+ start:3637 stop:3981 length:345 start_codon:yes stop_codon:yes gene_type:complete